MAADDPVEVENWVRQRVLGSGGFGVVTLWKHKVKDEMIALKKCRSGTDNLLTPKHKERWTKEVEIMQRLSHPNVVRAIEVPPDLATLRSELPLLCMEFCTKGDLRQILNRNENYCGLKECDVRALISDVKSAVQYLHSMKITHRDLKPENIVLQQNQNQIVYKLIDLGYAKEWDQSSLCTSFVGTLQYLAPELFMNKTYSSSVDYWSLGLVSHEVITGVRPFLPGMAPVTWMSHVRNKSSDDISAYQAQDGTIVFCKELFPQNHITSTLKSYMEEWLKVLLEWDPKKRGRDKDSKVIVFELMDNILRKKILHIFSVPTYKNLSYEIDEAMTTSVLKAKIEADTGVTVDEQELLLPNGELLDSSKEIFSCWTEDSIKDGSPMLFMFRARQLEIPQVTLQIPLDVRLMMEDPRKPLEYIYQKRAWAHAVFFLQQESELYHNFQQACHTKRLHIQFLADSVKLQTQAVLYQLQQIEAEERFTLQSLTLDVDHVHCHGGYEEVLQKWKKNWEAVVSEINNLQKKISDLQVCNNYISEGVNEMKSNQKFQHNTLSILLESGMKRYDTLRRLPREVRSQSRNNVEMARVVYQCLKQRDILLRDQPFNYHLRCIARVQEQAAQQLEALDKYLAEMKKLSLRLYEVQLNRQKDIWKLVEKQQGNDISVDKSNNMHSIQISSLLDSVVPAAAPFGSLGNSTSRNPIDTSSMIQHNLELRYMTQELMNESFQQYRSIVSEGQSLNWSHLDIHTST